MENQNKQKRWYNTENLGVIGTFVGHQSGEYTFLGYRNNPWIRTEDLRATKEVSPQGAIAHNTNGW